MTVAGAQGMEMHESNAGREDGALATLLESTELPPAEGVTERKSWTVERGYYAA